jgi:uncharacterized membrane protein
MKKSSFSFANILLSLLVIFIIYYVVMYISNNSVNMKSSTKEGFISRDATIGLSIFGALLVCFLFYTFYKGTIGNPYMTD